MIKVKEDLSGMKFGYWTVLYQTEDHISPSGKHRATWQCRCICGKEKPVLQIGLKDGTSTSCGCERNKRMKQNKILKKYNNYNLNGEYGIGYDYNNKEFYFDLEDYDKIKAYCWYIDFYGYVSSLDENNKRIKIHRIIMNLEDKKYDVDHINGNKTDNRKLNLRIVTRSQNNMNKTKMRTNTSGITGVSFNKKKGKWHSYITKNYKMIELGYYQDLNEAIKVRKQAENKYFGEYSYDNSRKREFCGEKEETSE